jgi:hypothetical protein
MRHPKSGTLTKEQVRKYKRVFVTTVQKPQLLFESFNNAGSDLHTTKHLWEDLPEDTLFEARMYTEKDCFDSSEIFVDLFYEGRLLMHGVYNTRFDFVKPVPAKKLEDFL